MTQQDDYKLAVELSDAYADGRWIEDGTTFVRWGFTGQDQPRADPYQDVVCTDAIEAMMEALNDSSDGNVKPADIAFIESWGEQPMTSEAFQEALARAKWYDQETGVTYNY